MIMTDSNGYHLIVNCKNIKNIYILGLDGYDKGFIIPVEVFHNSEVIDIKKKPYGFFLFCC